MDISTTQIAAGTAGTVTVGALVLLILQNLKAISGDWLNGPRAEAAGGFASLAAVAVSFMLAGATWDVPRTYGELFVAWMGVWVSARASYAMLFKVSVANLPPPPDAEVPPEAIEETPDERPAESVLRGTTRQPRDRLGAVHSLLRGR